MWRQPLRAGLLVLLIGIASFAFYLRTVEYIVVHEQISALGNLYRSIGFIRPAGNFWDDISPAAEIVNNSPHVEFVDRRVAVEGVIENIHMQDLGLNQFGHPIQRVPMLSSPDFGGNMPGLSDNHHLRVAESLIYATIRDIHIPPAHMRSPVWLEVRINYVFYGLPQHTVEGLVVWIRHEYALDDELGQLPASLAGIEIGGSYLLRTVYHITPATPSGFVIPRVNASNALDLRPLNNDGLWFAESGFDFTMPELAHIPEQIAFFNHHHRAVHLMPTTDMSALPMLQPWAALRLGFLNSIMPEAMRLMDGRLLNHRDHEEGNQVAVISQAFARNHGLIIGDILEISIPVTQQIVGLSQTYGDFVVRGTPEMEPYHVLQLEIVGIFHEFARGIVLPGAPLVYIPLSLLPEGLTILPPPLGAIPGFDSPYHLPSIWYSFVLTDSRTDQEFLLEYGEKLAEIGFELVLFESNSAEFWAIIDPMLLVITFNAAVFWAVLVLVLVLVVCLYLQQRRKEMAIQRALGFSTAKVVLRLVVSAIVFAVPAIVIGGYIGWSLAFGTAAQSVDALTHLVPGGSLVPMAELPISLFILIGTGILIVMLLMLFVSALYVIRFPVLEQLQGVLSRPKKKRKQAAVAEVDLPTPTEFVMPAPAPASGSGTIAKLRWAMRHILRSPVKSALGVVIALFFAIVLGWLQESMLRTQQEIDRLYETTVVWGEIVQMDPFEQWGDRELGDVIRQITVRRIIDTGFVENAYIESGHSRAFIISDDGGGFPDNWYEIIGYNRRLPLWQNFHTMNFLFAANDLERLIYLNTFDEEQGLQIEFAPGFTYSDFVYRGGRIPVLMPQSIMAQRGINLGDNIFIGYTPLFPSAWFGREAVVIGIHNGHMARESARNAPFIPLDYFEDIMGAMTMYTTYNFTIDTAHNRDILYVRETLENLVRGNSGLLTLRMFLADQSLMNMVSIAGQTLLMLQLVYPIAVGAAIFIAGGLAVLLMLQNAKRAATLHVLGATKRKTVMVLFVEHLIVCIAGFIPGIVILALMGVTFSIPLIISLAIYLAGVFAGAIGGAVLVVRKEPLELLQVKE